MRTSGETGSEKIENFTDVIRKCHLRAYVVKPMKGRRILKYDGRRPREGFRKRRVCIQRWEERRRGVTLTFFGPIETVTDRRAIKANRIPLEFDVNTERERCFMSAFDCFLKVFLPELDFAKTIHPWFSSYLLYVKSIGDQKQSPGKSFPCQIQSAPLKL